MLNPIVIVLPLKNGHTPKLSPGQVCCDEQDGQLVWHCCTPAGGHFALLDKEVASTGDGLFQKRRLQFASFGFEDVRKSNWVLEGKFWKDADEAA
jgi:hypothetical protein